jgi:PAS domain S-box-containing protein
MKDDERNWDDITKSEAYYRSLIENVSDIITILDEQGIIRYESPAYERILGLNVDEVIGKNAFDLLHPDDIPLVNKAFSEGLSTPGRMETSLFRLRHRDGTWRFFEALGRNLLDDPAVRGIVINSRDITESRRAEEALRDSEERYRMLVETSPYCIVLCDLDGRILMINGSGLTLLGYTDPDEIMGKNVMDLVAPESREQARASMRDKVFKGLSRTEEYNFVKRDGTHFPAEITATLITDTNGTPRGFIGQTRDITERRQAETVLRASEEKYRTVFESTGTAMCIADDDLLISFVNHEFRLLLGYELRDVEGKRRFTDFLPQDDLEPFMAYRRAVRESEGEPREHLGCSVRDRFGDVIFVLVSMGLIPGTDSVVISLIDISREKGYENALENTARQLRDFLSVASHELRHPITIIKGYVQLLQEIMAGISIEQVPMILGAIDQATERLDRLVDDLLDISRIEEGRFAVNKEVLELLPLLEQAVEGIRAGSDRDDFRIQVGEKATLVKADREKLNRLLVILLENATKFSPAGSPIEIQAEWGAGEVMVSVLDRGPGVPEEARELVFDRFFQVEDVLHHSKPGLGLGLYIASEIAHVHGGDIWYEPRDGGGSVFRFTLP